MSTSPDAAVAVAYSASGDSHTALLLKIATNSFIDRGADLSFVSCFPQELEYCYPPLSYLQPTGRVEVVPTLACTFSVIEVRPRFAS